METTAASTLDVADGTGGCARPEVIVSGACDAFERVAALVEALLAEIAVLSLAGAGRGVLRTLVEALGRLRAGADAAEARTVNALEELRDGGEGAVEVLRHSTGSSHREARRRLQRAGVLAQMPNVTGALAKGDISPEHADALARAASATSVEAVDDDAVLLAQVAAVPADCAGRHIQDWTQRNRDPADLHEQHLRQRRRRRLHFGDGDDGLLMAHAAFDRVVGAQFRSLINGIADRIWRAEGGRENPDARSVEQRRLDALAIAVGLQPGPPAATAGTEVNLDCGDDSASVAGPRDNGALRPLPPRHQVVIVASADLVSGKDPQGRCEIPGVGPIPQAELERLACGAHLFGLLFSGEGEPLWHGRGERAATDAQRRALVARDGGCVLCAAEPAWCEAHHIVPWAKPTEGPTDIDNLALLCSACHHRLHDRKRVLTRSTDGSWGTEPDPRQAVRRASRHRRRNGSEGLSVGDDATDGRWQACRAGPCEMSIDVLRWVRRSDWSVDPWFPGQQRTGDAFAGRSGGRRIAGGRKASGSELAIVSVASWVLTPIGHLPRSPPTCRRRTRSRVSRWRCRRLRVTHGRLTSGDKPGDAEIEA